MPILCWKCQKSRELIERIEIDKKTKKRWLIRYCPYVECAANHDIEELKGNFPYPEPHPDGLKPYKPPPNQSKWII